MLVGVSHRLARFNQSLSTGKENAGVEEVKCRWGGDSGVTRLPSKAAVGRLRRVLYDTKLNIMVRLQFWRLTLLSGPL